MDKKAEYFINEFVIGLGFLSGLWIAVGIDPQAELFKALNTFLNYVNPESRLGILFFLVPIVILFCSIIGAYFLGGKLGLIAVAFGFLGGLLFLASPLISIFVLFLGMVLGIIAVAG